MKKLFFALCASLCCLLVVGCNLNVPNKQTYKVTYVTDHGQIANTEYSTLADFVLEQPSLSTEEATKFSFVGWYETPDYNGDPVVKIVKGSTGDKVFYAKWNSLQVSTDVFDNIKTYANNFAYEASPVVLSSIGYIYLVNDKIIKVVKNNTTVYLVDTDDVDYALVSTTTGYKKVLATDAEYAELNEWVNNVLNLNALKASSFTYDAQYNTYVCKAEDVQSVGSALLNNTTSVISSIKINFTDNCIASISVEIDNVMWEYRLFDYNKVLPIPLPSVSTEVPTNPVNNAYTAAEGATVTVTGVVCGVVGNNFYITDNEKGVYVYLGSTTSTVEVGNLVTVTGTKETYKGLVEVKATEVKVDNAQTKYEVVTLTSLADVADYLAQPINAKGLKITSVPSSIDPAKDISFKVSDGTTEVTLFISKHLNATVKEALINVLADVTVGSVIEVSDGVISCYNSYQIALTNVSTVKTSGGTVNPPVGDADFNEIASVDNYAYTYKLSYTGPESYSYQDECEYFEGNTKCTYDYEGTLYTDYLMYNASNDTYTFYTSLDGVEYISIPDTDDFFNDYLSNLSFIDLTGFKAEYFTYANNTYTCKSAYLETMADSFLCGTYEGEVYSSFTFTTKDGLVDKVVVKSTYTDETGTYNYTYEVTVKKYNQVLFNAPSATEIDPSFSELSDIYLGEEGDQFSVCGYIVGVIGNNFYLAENGVGVYVYVGNNASNLDSYALGQYVCVTGTKETYKGLVELKDIQGITVLDEEVVEIEATTLTDLGNLGDYLSTPISYQNLRVVTPLTNTTPSTSSDASIVVSDGTNESTLFISKHLPLDLKNTWYSVLSTLKAGDLVNVNCAVISCYTNYQISFTNATTVSNGFVGEVEQTGIMPNKASFSVVNGTSLDSAMEKVTVYKTFNNSTKETLNRSEWTYACENYNPYTDGTYIVTITSGTFTTTVSIVVKPESPEAYKPAYGEIKILEDLVNDHDLTRGIKGVGDAKALIVPIAFSDYKASPDMKSNLEKAFFGTSADTGWESLQSYYKKSSYGKLNITGDVLEPYNLGKTAKYYNDIYVANQVDPVEEIIKSVLTYFDPTVNFSDYDSDGDGYIDALYLIYTAPVDYDSDSLWWAFTYEYFTSEVEQYDGVEADFYFFAGYDFIFEDLASGQNVAINTETFIHETGHILGISDYYDYDSTVGVEGGLGGGDMMDCNVGDHNGLTKILLGWTTPWVVQGKDFTTDLKSFGSSGDCIIVPIEWNNSYFTEFFLIDFYTPDGLNALEAGHSGLFSISGIRVYHVDCNLANPVEHVWEVFAYNNGTTKHKNITLVQATGVNTIDKGKLSTNADLFGVGKTLVNPKWYNGQSSNFTLTVNSITGNEKANVTISFN